MFKKYSGGEDNKTGGWKHGLYRFSKKDGNTDDICQRRMGTRMI
jgi:hypothetical protein